MKGFNKKLVIFIIILVIIDLAIYGFLGYLKRDKTTKENVEVTKTNLETKEGFAAVLSAFPGGIPFEYENITESFITNYIDHNVVQSGISYTSSKSKKDLYEIYKNFMKNNKFSIDEKNSSESLGTVFATKDNDDLSIVVSNSLDRYLIQLVFTNRN